MNKKQYNLMNWESIESIIYADCDKPCNILGLSEIKGEKLIQVFYPGALKVVLNIVKPSAKSLEMECVDEAGFFALFVTKYSVEEYTLDVFYKNSVEKGLKCPYDISPQVSADFISQYKSGKSLDAFKTLGCFHDKDTTTFVLWAPEALRVSLVGDFNEWDGRIYPMQRINDDCFAISVYGLNDGDRYQFELKLKGEKVVRKNDPYAVLFKNRCSVITSKLPFIGKKKKIGTFDKLNILQVSLGELIVKKTDNYHKAAASLIDYAKNHSYTHIQILPVNENDISDRMPYYHTGVYGIDGNKGTLSNLRDFVEDCHNAGIGVIYDFNIAFFSKERCGLSNFDGTCLFEHMDSRKSYHPFYDAIVYRYESGCVRSFLLSAVNYYISEFGFDGFYFGEIASMLYLDYQKSEGEWIPNDDGGKENYEAVSFIRDLNAYIHKKHSGVLTFAGIDAYWNNVTGKEPQSLGFDYMWNTGFESDIFDYTHLEADRRSNFYSKLVDNMDYAFSERFVLPLSYKDNKEDTFLHSIPGKTNEKLANLRFAYAYRAFYPGSRLTFFDIETLLEDSNIQKDERNKFAAFTLALQKFINGNSVLGKDFVKDDISFVNRELSSENVAVYYVRHDDECIMIVLNGSDENKNKFVFGVPFKGKYKEIFNSSDACFGGDGFGNKSVITTKEESIHGYDDCVSVKIPAFGVLAFAYRPFTDKELEEIRLKKRNILLKTIEEKKKIIEAEKESKIRQIKKEADEKEAELDNLLKEFDKRKN